MDVKCPKCGTINKVEDDVFLFDEIAKISCSGCGVKMTVRRKVKKKSTESPLQSPPPQPSPEKSELPFKEEGFFVPDEEISKTETEDMLKTEDFSLGGSPPAEEDFFSDEEFRLPDTKDMETSDFLSSPEEDFIKTHDFGVEKSVEERKESEEEAFFMPDERLDKEQPPIFYKDEEKVESDELTERLFAEEPTPQPAVSPPVSKPSPQPVFRPKVSPKVVAQRPKSRGRGWFGIVFIMFIIGGGAFGFWWKFLRNRNYNINPNIEIHVTESSSLVNTRGERVLYVKGVLTHNRGILSKIKLRAILTDPNGFKISEKEIYAGNIISEKDLRTLSPFEVEGILQRETGESLANVRVEPGKELGFMVVFYDPPRNVKVKIEVADYQEEK